MTTRWSPSFNIALIDNVISIEISKMPNCCKSAKSLELTILGKLCFYASGDCENPKVICSTKSRKWTDDGNVIKFGKKYIIHDLTITQRLRQMKTWHYAFDYFLFSLINNIKTF